MLSTSRTIERAVAALQGGSVVLYPTDTLLGLGAIATSEKGVSEVFKIKERPRSMPISVLLSSTEEIESWASLTPASRTIIREFLPGPYTFLVPASRLAINEFAEGIVSSDGSFGVRVPDHRVARELALRAGPITTTSANIHGKDDCKDVRAAKKAFGQGVTVYLPATPAPSGNPSSIVDLRGAKLRHISRDKVVNHR
jgi:L-threonylcarbamoyladenylate synthase